MEKTIKVSIPTYKIGVNNPTYKTVIQGCSVTTGSVNGKIKVSDSDTTPNFLNDKLITDTNITKTIINPSGNEQLELSIDLTPYTLVDGTRAFTGTVGGITPTANNHLATKGYIDTKLVDGYVPYTGANDDVDLGNFNLLATDGIFNGKVGIGTSTPTRKLEIQTSDLVSSLFNSSNIGQLVDYRVTDPNPQYVGFRLQSSLDGIVNSTKAFVGYDFVNDHLVFAQSQGFVASPWLRIDSNGNVSIPQDDKYFGMGANNESTRVYTGGNLVETLTSGTFVFQAPTTSTRGLMFSGGVNGYAIGMGGTSTAPFIQGYINVLGTGIKDIAIQPGGGNVGIGTYTPPDKLDVSNATGTSFGITTDKTAGTNATPLELDFNFRGYNNKILGQIKSLDKQASAFSSSLDISVRDSSDVLQSRVFIDGNTGNTGFGTSNPLVPVHVIDKGSQTGGIRVSRDGVPDQYIDITEDDLARHLIASYGAKPLVIRTEAGQNQPIQFQSNGLVSRVQIDGQGNMTIPADDKYFGMGANNESTRAYTGGNLVENLTSGDFAFIGGNVGIGTTAPVYELDVNGDIAVGINGILYGRRSDNVIVRMQEISVEDNFNSLRSSGGAFGVKIKDTVGNDLLTVLNSGDVGIGASNPVQKLDIFNAGVSAMSFHTDLTGELSTDGSFLGITQDGRFFLYNYENEPIIFGTNNIEAMRIDENQNVIIPNDDNYFGMGANGESTRAYTGGNLVETLTSGDFVYIGGNINIGNVNTGDRGMTIQGSTPYIVFSESSDPEATNVGTKMVYDGVSNTFKIQVAASSSWNDALSILRDNGNVGFGTSNPLAKMHIVDTTNATTIIESLDSSSSILNLKNSEQEWFVKTSGVNDFQIRDETAETIPFRIVAGAPNSSIDVASNGNAGFGTSNPQGKAHIFSGSAGGVLPPSSADDLVVEHISNAGISLLTPDINSSSVSFGSNSDSQGAIIRYSYTDKLLQVGTRLTGGELSIEVANAKPVIRVDSSGNTHLLDDGQGFLLGANKESRQEYITGNFVHTLTSGNFAFMGAKAGFGTTDAQAPMHTVGSSGAVPGADYEATAGIILENNNHSVMELISASDKTGQIFFSDSSLGRGRINYDHSTDTLSLWAGSTQHLTILSSGYVGIGTTSTSNDLTILPKISGGGITIREADDEFNAVKILGGNFGGSLQLFNGGVLKVNLTGLGSSNYINNGYNFGMGTDNPLGTAHVGTYGDYTKGLMIGNNSIGNSIYQKGNTGAQLYFALAGADKWLMIGETLRAAVGSGGALVNEVSTNSNPTLLMRNNDEDTGFGGLNANNISMINGGIESVRITDDRNMIMYADGKYFGLGSNAESQQSYTGGHYVHTIASGKFKYFGAIYNEYDGGTYQNIVTINDPAFSINAGFQIFSNRLSAKTFSVETNGSNLLFRNTTTDTGKMLVQNSTGGNIASFDFSAPNGSLTVNSLGNLISVRNVIQKGSVKAIVTKTANYIVESTDYTIIADGTSNTVTITMPSSPTEGQIFNIACINSDNDVNIDFNGKNFYDSPDNELLFKGENLTVQFDGTQWIGA